MLSGNTKRGNKNFNRMTTVPESKNLVEGLMDEILRVTEIKREYDSLPNGAGKFAAYFMQQALDTARRAQASGDILQMIPALQALKEFEL